MISVYMITKDCDDTIRMSIEYAKTISKDVVVVDGGSTDNTLNILRKDFSIRLYEHPMPLSFAEQRNWAVEQCRNEWIVQLDSDEIYTPGISDAIRKCIAFNCIAVNIPTFHLMGDMEHYSPMLYPDPHIRIFKKGLRYNRDIHEKIDFPERTRIYHANGLHLVHFGHLRNTENQIKKFHSRKNFITNDYIDGKQMTSETYFEDRNIIFNRRKLDDLTILTIRKAWEKNK